MLLRETEINSPFLPRMAPSFIYIEVACSPDWSDRGASKGHPPPTRSFGTHHPLVMPLFPGRPKPSTPLSINHINNGSQCS